MADKVGSNVRFRYNLFSAESQILINKPFPEMSEIVVHMIYNTIQKASRYSPENLYLIMDSAEQEDIIYYLKLVTALLS